MRRAFLPQVSLPGARLGQNGNGEPAPAPAPGNGAEPSHSNGHRNVTIIRTSPFYPYWYGPGVPFYWQAPPAAPSNPRYVCKREEDEDTGEEKFVCEVDPDYYPPRVPYYPTVPIGWRWFF